MGKKILSLTNLNFLLFEVHKLEELLNHHYYRHQDREAVNLILDSAMKIAEKHLLPYLSEMDRNPPELINGEVVTHPNVAKLIKALAEGGWYSATSPMEVGGMQIPHMVDAAANFIFQSANNGAYGFNGLTTGAANLIIEFASDELIKQYVPHLQSGQWQGTMALTEPNAGSSLGDMTSSASSTGQPGLYKIKGQKIFISAGDHQHAENIVHMMLARIEGEPAGSRGISLFIVPKYRFEKRKKCANDVKTVGIFHKMGQKGTPTVHLSMGEKNDCYGYLVGDKNRGLAYMFKLMNEARISVGICATSIASAAYYQALEYANERPQGRPRDGKPEDKQINIIEHPDIRRMLLKQKSIVEGSLSLILQCANFADKVKTSEGDLRDQYQLLLDLLTPVVKTYPSERGIESVSEALQVLGGYGYCEDFCLEQLYRDIRICPIYEGTTGIQSLDLLGRKVFMQNGKPMQLLAKEIESTVHSARYYEELNDVVDPFVAGYDELKKVTHHLLAYAMKNTPDMYLADATVYMEMFGLVCMGWQWVKQGVSIVDACRKNVENLENPFHQGKLHTMRYFFSYEYTRIYSLSATLRNNQELTISMDKSWLE